MARSATCPHCGKKYQLSEKLAGRTVRCKACQNQFTFTPSDDGPIDLAPPLQPPPPKPRPSILEPGSAAKGAQPAESAPRALQILSRFVGPIDASFWIVSAFVLADVVGILIPAAMNTAACSAIIVGLVMFLWGGMAAAGFMVDEGVSPLRFLSIFFGPIIFLIFFYDAMRSNWEIYKRPVFYQLRGILLILATTTSAEICRNRIAAAQDRRTAERIHKLRESAAQSQAASQSRPANSPSAESR